MKTIFFAAALLSTITTSCVQQTTESAGNDTIENFSIETFPSQWVQVQQKDNKWVIFEPCDAANPEFKFGKENGKDILTFLSGQSADPYSIESYSMQPDSSVHFITYVGENSPTFEFTFSKTKEKHIWTIKTPDNSSSNFIEAKYKGNFSKFVQPCRECWDEEQCAEMEKSK